MATSNSASVTMSLKDKLAKARQVRLAQVSATAKVERTIIDVPATPNIAGAVTDDALSAGFSNLSKQIARANDKLATHIQKQEESGAYKFSEKIGDIEGLDGAEFIARMHALDAATVEKTPDIGTLSIKIRQNLQQYPELTHILTDAQLGIISSGVLYVAGVETEPKTKQGKAIKDKLDIKKLSETSIDELF
jgi:hypothetical protein